MTRLVGFVSSAALALLVLGCEQGVGDRCQTQSDCKSGLVCSESLHICQDIAEGSDSGVVPPPDAETGDLPDASDIDAPPPDAVPVIDASEDAAAPDATPGG
jgi:hypothetical protein